MFLVGSPHVPGGKHTYSWCVAPQVDIFAGDLQQKYPKKIPSVLIMMAPPLFKLSA
jgi:hypothetical protein